MLQLETMTIELGEQESQQPIGGFFFFSDVPPSVLVQCTTYKMIYHQ